LDLCDSRGERDSRAVCHVAAEKALERHAGILRHDPQEGPRAADLADRSAGMVAHSSGATDEALMVHRHQGLLHRGPVVEETDVDAEEALNPSAARHRHSTGARHPEEATAAAEPTAEPTEKTSKVTPRVVVREVRLRLRANRDPVALCHASPQV
jgi:hypothetical protein